MLNCNVIFHLEAVGKGESELQELHDLMEGDVAIVDLRLPGRIILRQSPKTEENMELKSDRTSKQINPKLRWDT